MGNLISFEAKRGFDDYPTIFKLLKPIIDKINKVIKANKAEIRSNKEGRCSCRN